MQLCYRNSGLHIEPFFKSYDLLPLNLNENLYNGNFEIIHKFNVKVARALLQFDLNNC